MAPPTQAQRCENLRNAAMARLLQFKLSIESVLSDPETILADLCSEKQELKAIETDFNKNQGELESLGEGIEQRSEFKEIFKKVLSSIQRKEHAIVALEKLEQERLEALKKSEQDKIDYERKLEQERLEALKKSEQDKLDYERKLQQEKLEYERRLEQEALDYQRKVDREEADRATAVNTETKTFHRLIKELLDLTERARSVDFQSENALQKCKQYRSTADRLFNEILVSFEKVTHAGTDVEVDCNYYEVYDNLMCDLNTFIDSHERLLMDNHSNSSRSSRERHTHCSIKLPKLPLPFFDGDSAEWIGFKDSIKNTVLENTSLADIDKYQYLKAALGPKSSQTIANIPLTATNLSVAWATLCKRYDNPRLIALNHIDKLFAPPAILKNDPDSLQVFADHFSSSYNALKALQLNVELHELLISKLILDKLPVVFIKEWEQHTLNLTPTLDMLLEFINTRVNVLRHTNASAASQLSAHQNDKTHKVTKDRPQTVKSSFFNSERCKLCNQSSHPMFYCQAFKMMSIKEKEAFVRQNNVCNICLSTKGHLSNCNTYKCAKCHGRHSSLMHRDSNGNVKHTAQSAAVNAITNERKNQKPQFNQFEKCKLCNESKHPLFHCQKFLSMTIEERENIVTVGNICSRCLAAKGHLSKCMEYNCLSCQQHHHTLLHREINPEAQPFVPQESTNAMNRNASQPCFKATAKQPAKTNDNAPLLPTAIVQVRSVSGEYVKATALIDCGSTCNVISREFLSLLGLKASKNTVNLTSVMNQSGDLKPTVELSIASTQSKWKNNIQAVVNEQIIGNMPSISFDVSTWRIPQQLYLANPSFNRSARIDLLLGVEIYAKSLLPGQIKVKHYPVIQNTEFGWILFGEMPKGAPKLPRKKKNFNASMTTTQAVSEQLAKFWELDSAEMSSLTEEEQRAEKHFQDNVFRTKEEGVAVIAERSNYIND